MSYTEDKSGFYSALLFMVWPLLSMASAIKNYDKGWAKNVFWAFCTFYGFSFAIGAESSSSDIVRYAAEVNSLHGTQMTLAMALEYFANSGEVDILRTFIAVTLSRFTGSQAILTGLYGFIFGYFLSRNIWYLLDRLKGNFQFVTILLIACFFLVNPIWNLNGFRMWTAAHVFVFGLLPYLYESKRKGILVAAASILVHFSFIVPVGVLIVHSLLGNRYTLYFLFFILTFFISEINITAFNEVIENYAPEALQERTSGYRNEANVEDHRESEPTSRKNWYAAYYGKALSWSIMGFIVILYSKGRDILRDHRGWMNLFCFTTLFYGIANLMSSLPSGGRFVTVANLSALALIILYVQNVPHEKTMTRFIKVAIPAILLFIIVSVRVGVYSFSPTILFGNPIIALFTMGENMSLNDFLRFIL